jgi:acyl carrier protein
MPGDTDAILERLTTVFKKTFHLPADTKITSSTTSADVDGWDSLAHASLIMSVEEEFGIELPMDRVYDLKDVGELIELVAAASR